MIKLNVQKLLRTSSGTMQLDVGFTISKGELITLHGESGVGKTTLLKMLAGLITPDAGTIYVDGHCWFDSSQDSNLTPQRRGVGFVFQDYALFPNMSVRENLEFAQGKHQRPQQITELLEMMELTGLQNVKPAMLSGGQQQRVALARALAQRPDILVLDEPLAALDSKMRQRLQQFVIDVHQRYALTTILVSHDVSEILKLSDRVLELKEGRIVREARSKDFFAVHRTSAKFSVTGEIVRIDVQGVVSILSIRVGQDIIRVVAELEESSSFAPGDKVMVASKAFNPIIQKI